MLCMRYLAIWRRRVHCLLARSLVFAHSCIKAFKNGQRLKDLKYSMLWTKKFVVMVVCGQVLGFGFWHMQCNATGFIRPEVEKKAIGNPSTVSLMIVDLFSNSIRNQKSKKSQIWHLCTPLFQRNFHVDDRMEDDICRVRDELGPIIEHPSWIMGS